MVDSTATLIAMASPAPITEGIRINTVAGTTLPRVTYLDHLAADYARFRSLIFTSDAAVPSCPGWTTSHLAEHLAHVYWHQSHVVKNGVRPTAGEHLPDFTFADSPQRYLDLAFEAIRKALDPSRSPQRDVWTFDPRSTTVDFWFRRMAHETMVHRFDAELACGATTAFDDALCLDGVDELMSWVPMLAEAPHVDLPDIGTVALSVAGVRPVRYVLEVRPGHSVARTVQRLPDGCRLEITGAAEDINLLLWGRMPATHPRLIVDGAAEDVATLLGALAPLGA